jgi:hypothetical protein
MHKHSSLLLVEKIVALGGGNLRELLADETIPYDEIARRLRNEHGVNVSRTRLARYAAQLGLPPRGSTAKQAS